MWSTRTNDSRRPFLKRLSTCVLSEVNIAKEFAFLLPASVGGLLRAHFGVATRSTLDLRTDTVSSAAKWMKYISRSLYTNLIMVIRCWPYRPQCFHWSSFMVHGLTFKVRRIWTKKRGVRRHQGDNGLDFGLNAIRLDSPEWKINHSNSLFNATPILV